jgi:hypothetical protein
MPKRRKRPQQPDGWSWLCRLAAAEGINLQRMSLAEAADRAVSKLEHQRDASLPLRPQTVQFAALLVRLEGKTAASGATSAEPFVERAYARVRARRLREQYEAGWQVHTNPGALPQDEPEPEPEWVTVYDLSCQAQSIAREMERLRLLLAADRRP